MYTGSDTFQNTVPGFAGVKTNAAKELKIFTKDIEGVRE